MRRLIDGVLASVIACTAVISPALAGLVPPTPAPVVGLGIPALVAFGLLYKRMRNRNSGK